MPIDRYRISVVCGGHTYSGTSDDWYSLKRPDYDITLSCPVNISCTAITAMPLTISAFIGDVWPVSNSWSVTQGTANLGSLTGHCTLAPSLCTVSVIAFISQFGPFFGNAVRLDLSLCRTAHTHTYTRT